MIFHDLSKEEFLESIYDAVKCEKIYEGIRVVNPKTKKVYSCEGNRVIEEYEECYKVWGVADACQNCISMRAYNENQTCIKFENENNNDVFKLVMAVPLVIKGEKLVVELIKDVANNNLMIQGMMNNDLEAKAVIEKANLAAVTDELTGIYNKKYIMERLPYEIISQQLNRNTVAIVMVDLDFFKNVNDTYGHLGGDFVLTEFAAIISEDLRKENDWVARFGGEEFLVFLSAKNKKDIISIVERMRKKVAEHIFNYEGKKIKITASFGVYFLDEGSRVDYSKVINAADDMLYKAKKSGRNCTMY